jgi:hypothetical protein
MRSGCLIFICFSAFNVACSQSRIVSPPVNNNSSNDLWYPSDRQLTPAFPNGHESFMDTSSFSTVVPAFQPGVIITKEDDTLAGLVKYASSVPLDKVTYRSNLISSDSVFSVSDIKSVITQFEYFANIPFEGKERMMRWLAVGKINLYGFAKYYSAGSSEITYVLKKTEDQFIYINKNDFKVMMKHVFFDTPDMLNKIRKRGYRFNDMIEIIREYNKGFQ